MMWAWHFNSLNTRQTFDKRNKLAGMKKKGN